MLVPVATSQVDLWATEGVLDLARREKCDTLIVLNRTRPHTRLAAEIAQKAAELGAEVAAAQVANRVLYAETLGQGLGAADGARGNPAARAEVDDLDVPPGTYGQFAGFRVVAFTPDVAVIAFVSRFALTGRLQTTTTTVKWADGD